MDGFWRKATDWCLVGNEGMDPKESLLGLIPSFPTKHQSGHDGWESTWTPQQEEPMLFARSKDLDWTAFRTAILLDRTFQPPRSQMWADVGALSSAPSVVSAAARTGRHRHPEDRPLRRRPFWRFKHGE